MTIKYHTDLTQGSDEWFAARCGLLTASEMKHIITPAKLQYASNDKERTHLYELLAQRITKYVEPSYISDDMLKGLDDELDAKRYYEDNFARVTDCGFVTNNRFGFTLGWSPDGLIGDDGFIECKGRRQKYQVQTIVEGKMPEEFLTQIQTAFLVSERAYCEFISFHGGLPMFPLTIFPDKKIMKAIEDAAKQFHEKLDKIFTIYQERLADKSMRLIPTERRIEREITL